MNDRYTKGYLTVIAVLLAAIVLRGHPPVKPAPEIQKVVICVDKEGRYCGTPFAAHVKVQNHSQRVYFDQPVTVTNDGSFAFK